MCRAGSLFPIDARDDSIQTDVPILRADSKGSDIIHAVSHGGRCEVCESPPNSAQLHLSSSCIYPCPFACPQRHKRRTACRKPSLMAPRQRRAFSARLGGDGREGGRVSAACAPPPPTLFTGHTKRAGLARGNQHRSFLLCRPSDVCGSFCDPLTWTDTFIPFLTFAFDQPDDLTKKYQPR